VSRTAKCLNVGERSTTPSSNGAGASDADDRVLRELLRLREQAFEASYKRKLEAVALFLQRGDGRQIEQCAHASLRTVQRWAQRAREFGAVALRKRVRNCETSKLSDELRVRLAADLEQLPSILGYRQPIWTAALLVRHIRKNYSISFSLRHCRRLLTTFGVTKRAASMPPSPKRKLAQSTIPGHLEPTTLPPGGDYARKRRALAAVRRLAASGMPLQPFAYTLFDLINDAVPHDEASPGLTAAASGESSRWVIRNFDYSRWCSQMQKYLLLDNPEVSGFRPPSLLPQNPHTVLRHEEIVHPNYYRSEGYN
jgi:transposase